MDIFVARQPIFDRRREVVGYELLFRSGLENAFGNNQADQASLAMLNTTLLGFGLDSLVGDKSAFINASRDVMIKEHWALFPPERTVIELLETVEPDDEIISACLAAKRAGYRIALDDFAWRPEYEPLLPHVDCIKVDFLATTGDQRAELVRRFARPGLRMLAEKVETYQEFHAGLAAGYDLFQGYFFCRPEMVTGRDVQPLQANLVRLLTEVSRPQIDFDSLEALIKREVTLSVKLLRYLHSAGLGWRHEVNSIGQALRVLGERPTRKWASLVSLTLIGEAKPRELMTTSLVRAQFCEELGALASLPDRQVDHFLAGLLSTLDAILNQPMEQLLGQLSISDEISHALLDGDSLLGDTLRLAIAYDRADWWRVDSLSAKSAIAPKHLPEAYRRAVNWVNGVLADN